MVSHRQNNITSLRTCECAESLLQLPDLDCREHSPLVDPLEALGVEIVTELTEQCNLVHADLHGVVVRAVEEHY